jgi:small-conductance mechanosensitive channel
LTQGLASAVFALALLFAPVASAQDAPSTSAPAAAKPNEAPPSASSASDNDPTSAADVPRVLSRLDPLKRALDEIQDTLREGNPSAETLSKLRQTTITTGEALAERITRLEPRVAEAQARLKQLGPAPAKDAPAEAPTVASEREQLTRFVSNLDGALKQMKLLSVRAEQLGQRVTERRQTMYARQLFERSPSILDPSLWIAAARAIPDEAGRIGERLSSWASDVGISGGIKLAAALLLIIALIVLAAGITRRWLPRLDVGPRSDSRFARARTGFAIFVWLAVRAPLVVGAAILILEGFDLLNYGLDTIARGVLAATIAAAFGRGVARGMLAPDKPERRLIAIDDTTALSFHDHLVWTTRVLGVIIILQVIHRTVFAPLVLSSATSAIFGLAVSALLLRLISRLRRAEEAAGDAAFRAPWVRPIAWIVIGVIMVSLIAGYARFASFVSLRAVVAGAALAALYLLLVITDAIFTETLRGDTKRGRAIAANLGVAPRNLELVGTLISAAVRVLLILFALILIVGPWEASTAGLFESIQSLPLGFRIGEVYISFRSILAAAAMLVVALILTRIVQRWLQSQFLPRTAIEPSLQLSIGTIFGYVGVITAISLALGGLGIDLQKIAIVAGALSVGIGFGLQSIVSNFVSGLILLAERPIRVGDQVVVKGESGWVRRVRVRATEIETFDRATVIIPNSEFITGVVMNWTHANTMGRFIVKVGVGYESDPAQVRDILLAIAADHPKVLKTPGPWAQLTNLGESSLDFEMGCMVADVGDRGAVKSDLHFEILKRFKENGIEIPYPQREVRIRQADATAPGNPSGDGGVFAPQQPQS